MDLFQARNLPYGPDWIEGLAEVLSPAKNRLPGRVLTSDRFGSIRKNKNI
jgi:hypothetical protein